MLQTYSTSCCYCLHFKWKHSWKGDISVGAAVTQEMTSLAVFAVQMFFIHLVYNGDMKTVRNAASLTGHSAVIFLGDFPPGGRHTCTLKAGYIGKWFECVTWATDGNICLWKYVWLCMCPGCVHQQIHIARICSYLWNAVMFACIITEK